MLGLTQPFSVNHPALIAKIRPLQKILALCCGRAGLQKQSRIHHHVVMQSGQRVGTRQFEHQASFAPIRSKKGSGLLFWHGVLESVSRSFAVRCGDTHHPASVFRAQPPSRVGGETDLSKRCWLPVSSCYKCAVVMRANLFFLRSVGAVRHGARLTMRVQGHTT